MWRRGRESLRLSGLWLGPPECECEWKVYMGNRKSFRFGESGENTKISCKLRVLTFCYLSEGWDGCLLSPHSPPVGGRSWLRWPLGTFLARAVRSRTFQRGPRSSLFSEASRAAGTCCCCWMISNSVMSSHKCFLRPKIFHILKKNATWRENNLPLWGM